MSKLRRIDYVLALDQGTTSCRAILFDRRGDVAGVAQKELTQFFPRPGWVEHDPLEIWSAQVGVAHEAMARTGLSPSDVRAIGVANQRETIVVWERATGRPIHPAIVWQDRRTADQCDALIAQGAEARIQDKTGLVIDPYFSATKLRWILDHVEGARAQAERGELLAGTIDAWLVWKLTNGAVHATDPSNASRTLLYALASGDWDDELLGLFDVPRSILPEIRPTRGAFGATHEFGGTIPIAAVAGDQQAALFGQACHGAGMAKNTYGTGCFLLMTTGQPVRSRARLLSTVAWRADGATQHALEGSVFVGGAVVQWLRDGLGLIRESGDVEALAGNVPDSGGVVLVPAFVGLGAPHWDSRARGTAFGITRGTTGAHVARAALESIAFQSAEVLRAMQVDSGVELSELRVDGGAARNDLLMQIQADLLGVPVVRPAVTETTALGAAYQAGLAVGAWSSEDEIAALWREDRRFEPTVSRDEVESRLARWSRAVERTRGWEE